MKNTDMFSIATALSELEAEMRRIGYWSENPAPAANLDSLFSGMSFEKWLQFEFLPKTLEATTSSDLSKLPPYKIGLAAMRQYDYHSYVSEAQTLLSLCWKLEKLLSEFGKS